MFTSKMHQHFFLLFTREIQVKVLDVCCAVKNSSIY